MGKTFETKKRILELLKKGPTTPTDIYQALGLAPSTVSQHLKELKEMDRIEELYDEHFKNIKYYKLLESGPIEMQVQGFQPSKLRYALGAIAVLALLGTFFLLSNSAALNSPTSALGTAGQSGFKNVQVSLTDPPHVPNGTTALNIKYSGLQVLAGNTLATSSWISLNSTGSVDLLGLVNASTVLGNAIIPANEQVQKVRFDITNANITVNSITYPVIVPSNTVLATVSSNASSRNSTVLLDLSPTVAVVYTNNSTIFIMVPSVKAVLVPGERLKLAVLHGHHNESELNESEKSALAANSPNITITGISLSTSGNKTSISVTVKDDSNDSVVLKHVLVSGNEAISADIGLSVRNGELEVDARPSSQDEGVQSGIDGSISSLVSGTTGTSGNAGGNAAVDQSSGNGNGSFGLNLNAKADQDIELDTHDLEQLASRLAAGSNGSANGLANLSGNLSIIAKLNLTQKQIARLKERTEDMHKISVNQSRFQVLNFIVQQNGTLALPRSSEDFDGSTGFTLSPGQSATLTFNGTLTIADGRIMLGLSKGAAYRVVVAGEEGAEASTNATAV